MANYTLCNYFIAQKCEKQPTFVVSPTSPFFCDAIKHKDPKVIFATMDRSLMRAPLPVPRSTSAKKRTALMPHYEYPHVFVSYQSIKNAQVFSRNYDGKCEAIILCSLKYKLYGFI